MQETWVQCISWEGYPGGGNGNPLQYSCLENPMDRGAWWDIARGGSKSWIQLSSQNGQNNKLFHPDPHRVPPSLVPKYSPRDNSEIQVLHFIN